jgi:hypothetical protein
MAGSEQQKSYVLTVAESKRLIGRGVAACAEVQSALEEGIVAVAKGTTDGYVVEEITGETIDRTLYCTGTTQPAAGTSDVRVANELDDLVLQNGEPMEGFSATESVGEMAPDDVFIKGANALNYDLGQAGVLIGHPTGGTVGAAMGTIFARRITLIIPVGLEKSIPGDLYETAQALNRSGQSGRGPTLWPIQGEIFTELEALEVLAGVHAHPIAAGGILGAEGSVRIAVWGTEEQVERADATIDSVRGEPAFGQSE